MKRVQAERVVMEGLIRPMPRGDMKMMMEWVGVQREALKELKRYREEGE